MDKRSHLNGADARLEEAAREARRVARWHARLAPELPHIDAHDLDLIIAAMLRTRRQRMRLMFLKRRKDGRYEF